MHCACQKGDMRVVQHLIQAGANLDIPMPVNHSVEIDNTYHYSMYIQDGSTGLHLACVVGQVEVVQQFIQAGCNRIIDAQTKVSISICT